MPIFTPVPRVMTQDYPQLQQSSTAVLPPHRSGRHGLASLFRARAHRSSAMGASAQAHSSTDVPAPGGAPASSVAGASSEGRDRRGQTMEENMKVLSSDELLRCSKLELIDLFRQTEADLCKLPEGTLEREIALLNRHKIRRALARLDIGL
jgi:hypothetical protein